MHEPVYPKMSHQSCQKISPEKRLPASLNQEDKNTQLQQSSAQHPRYDPYTQTTEDFEVHISPLFNAPIFQDISITGPRPRILELLHEPIPRPLSLHRTQRQLKTCSKGHSHQPWPQHGNVFVEKCETFCFFCGLEVQTAATLRKHVTQKHKVKESMPIVVVKSQSGRSRDVLSLAVNQNDHTPRQNQLTNTSHQKIDDKPQDPPGSANLPSVMGLDVPFHPNSGTRPQPNVEQSIDPGPAQERPSSLPQTSTTHLPEFSEREFADLRATVNEMQQQHESISDVLKFLHDRNVELYSDADAFQTLHDRHQSAITPILEFLASLYSQSFSDSRS
ncbi:hypothetical protein FB567DRAFT_524758 [Paraphoma chrysanthemicola]|uniref:Uncharacterized protein n=1 Tax=Paraphoma chrysanthemicola TaxID=798071 RepID=A0A8K0R838_9PLEO|nr:hypothetical protein FB567DRAFT_524758 [Paraphoma chrysanthemicola]